MEREYVVSSAIDSVGYDELSETLEIEFCSGGVYQYYDVPESVYEELMDAASIGSFFHEHIRGIYESLLLEEPVGYSKIRGFGLRSRSQRPFEKLRRACRVNRWGSTAKHWSYRKRW